MKWPVPVISSMIAMPRPTLSVAEAPDFISKASHNHQKILSLKCPFVKALDYLNLPRQALKDRTD
jgi:hypothetical protein